MLSIIDLALNLSLDHVGKVLNRQNSIILVFVYLEVVNCSHHLVKYMSRLQGLRCIQSQGIELRLFKIVTNLST